MTGIALMFLGIDPALVLTATVVLATLLTTLAMLAVVFFAWAPFLSEGWRTQFGATSEVGSPDDTPAD